MEPKHKLPVVSIDHYRSCRGLEGESFACRILFDGKPVGHAHYGGDGGPYHYDFDAPEHEATLVAWAMQSKGRAEARAKYPEFKDSDPLLDIAFEDLICDQRDAQTFARSKNLYFRMEPGGKAYYVPKSNRWDKKYQDRIRVKFPKAVFLNAVGG